MANLMGVVALALTLLAIVVVPAYAMTYDLTPTTPGWATTLSNLQAGDEAILTAGTFELDTYFELDLQGAEAAGITIRGAGASQTIIQQNTGENVVNIQGQYYSFYNMFFTGGSRGIRLLSGSHATFDGVNVYGVQSSAFSANDVGETYSHLTLRRMEIWDVNCFYLGCNNDDCRVHDSLVELNFCHDTVNAAIGYGSAIQLKTGSYNNIIRDNVVFNTGGPGILIYDDFQRGLNIVEGNVIVGTNDNGLQLSSGAIIRNNIIVNAASYGIYVANNQNEVDGVYRNIKIEHNTVYGSGTSDLFLPGLTGSQFVIANNAFLSSSNAFSVGTQASTVWLQNAYVSGTLPTGVPAAGIFEVSLGAVTSAATNDFYPSSGSALVNAGSTDYASRATIDFNHTPRSGTPTVGAYEYTTVTNPGWTITRGFKNSQAESSSASSMTSPLTFLIHLF